MFGSSNLSLYIPIFMTELLLAEWIFAFCLDKRKHFLIRFLLSTACCLFISFFYPVIQFSPLGNTVYCTVMFLVLFGITLLALKVCFCAPIKDVLFCAIAGYTVQHITQEVFELFNIVFGIDENISLIFYGIEGGGVSLSDFAENWLFVMFWIMAYILSYAGMYIGAYFLFGKKKKSLDVLRLNSGTMLFIVSFIVFIDIVFGVILIYLVPAGTNNAIALSLLHIYNIACCVLSLILLFVLPQKNRLELELNSVRQLQHKQKEQYYISKENIELINIKCHDLKHQIRKASETQQFNGETAQELERLIDIYDSDFQTEKESLNVILMEKSLVCKKQGIALSCIVDGAKLSFMSDTDVYALFGNLLDNAIEAVHKLDESKRCIGLSVKSVGMFVVINIYNWYEGKILFDDGALPITTKADKRYHGFGLKSIKYIVEKYDGQIAITTENSVFDINIVFPDAQEGEKA